MEKIMNMKIGYKGNFEKSVLSDIIFYLQSIYKYFKGRKILI